MPPSILSFPANNAEGVDDSMDSGERSSGEGVRAKEKGVEECVRDNIRRVENVDDEKLVDAMRPIGDLRSPS